MVALQPTPASFRCESRRGFTPHAGGPVQLTVALRPTVSAPSFCPWPAVWPCKPYRCVRPTQPCKLPRVSLLSLANLALQPRLVSNHVFQALQAWRYIRPFSVLYLILYRILSYGTARSCTGSFLCYFGVTPPCECVFLPFLAWYRPVRVPTLFVLLFGIAMKACLSGGLHHLSLSRATRASTIVVPRLLVSCGLHSPAPWVAARTSDITWSPDLES